MPVIYEPLYRAIHIPQWEAKLLSLPFMQRLRNVKQMGPVQLIFLGANHTRFEHSIGASYLAGKMAESIEKKASLPKDELEHNIQLCQIAALMHDVGHPPFSHSTESIVMRKLGITHEDISSEIIRCNVDEIKKCCNGAINNSDIEKITNMIAGGIDDKEKYLKEIVSGTIDADRMDFLRRDAYYTGVAVGTMNVERLIMFLTKTSIGPSNRMVVEEEGISEVASLLFTRDLNYAGIVFRPDVRSVNASLLRAVERLLDENADNIKTFLKDTDIFAIEQLRSKKDPVINRLLALLEGEMYLPHIPSRDPITWDRLAQLNAQLFESIKTLGNKQAMKDFHSFIYNVRNYLEENIKEKLKTDCVMVDIPPPPLKIHELDTFVLTNGEPKLLRYQIPVLEGVEKSSLSRWRLLVFTESSHCTIENFSVVEKTIQDCPTRFS